VDAGAFRGCSSLVELFLPNQVKEIGRGAFEGCTSLAALSLGKIAAGLGNRWLWSIPHSVIILERS
jgi:hypothetical protein